MEFTIKLQEQELKQLVEMLGELPTKSGAYVILANIVNQANNQPQPNNEQSTDNGVV
jgi:hypothetical protein